MNKIKSKNGLKGQAMMEYLMTYGFAIFVIVVILAVLAFYLPQFVNTPATCLFDKTEFDCQDRPPALIADSSNNVELVIKVQNNDNRAILVTRALCTVVPKAEIKKGTPFETAFSPELKVAAGASTPDNWKSFKCSSKTGQDRLSLTANSEFRGHFVIWYKYEDDLPGVPERKSTAVLTGRVLEK